MKIGGMVHCFFEQSGTFKNEFRKLGIYAEDYDIQNEFGETDNVTDLFTEIDNAYRGGGSVFDRITHDDLIVAFFPCIYFSVSAQTYFRLSCNNTKSLKGKEKYDLILRRADERNDYYKLLVKLCSICLMRGLRIVVENPITQPSYLINNFLKNPDIMDYNRRERGDYFKKPTGYWFFNCAPTHGYTFQKCKEEKKIFTARGSKKAGICSTERSMISTDYARNWICDFILGKDQDEFHQVSVF